MSTEEILAAYPDLEPEDIRESVLVRRRGGAGMRAVVDNPMKLLVDNALSPWVAEDLRQASYMHHPARYVSRTSCPVSALWKRASITFAWATPSSAGGSSLPARTQRAK